MLTEQQYRDSKTKRATSRANIAPYIGGAAILMGFAVVATFLIQSGAFVSVIPKSVTAVDQPAKVDKVVSGQSSRITGFDKNKQPFELTAQAGNQDANQLDLVHLRGLTGTFHRADGGAIAITSKIAEYNATKKSLDLTGNVTIEEVGHYKARMEAANVNVDDHSLSSQTPVQVDTASGTVEADSMLVGPYGSHISFKGHVKARFATDSNYGEKQ